MKKAYPGIFHSIFAKTNTLISSIATNVNTFSQLLNTIEAESDRGAGYLHEYKTNGSKPELKMTVPVDCTSIFSFDIEPSTGSNFIINYVSQRLLVYN